MLKSREESDPYLTQLKTLLEQREPGENMKYIELSAKTVAESSILYFIFSLSSLHYSDVNRHESGRCHTLPPFQVYLLY